MRQIILVTGIAAAMCVSSAWGADDDIIFDAKNFAEFGENVGISGTLTGDGIAYKNNTYAIFCDKDRRECAITSIDQIGDKLMGRLDYPYFFPISKWNAYEIVATEDTADWNCSKTTITIVRKSKTALWVQEPINQTRPQCQKSDTKIHKWTIDDSPGWKRLHSR